MKLPQYKTILFSCFTILCSVLATSQDKNSTEFVIENISDFNGLMQKFIAHDNFIQSDNYGVITTELRNSSTKPNWSHQYHYRIIKQDAQLIIKPYWTMALTLDLGSVETPAQLEKWHYSNGKNINGFIYQETMQILEDAGITEVLFR